MWKEVGRGTTGEFEWSERKKSKNLGKTFVKIVPSALLARAAQFRCPAPARCVHLLNEYIESKESRVFFKEER